MQATTMASISRLTTATAYSLSSCPPPLYIPKTRISIWRPANPRIITRIFSGPGKMDPYNARIHTSSKVGDTAVKFPIKLNLPVSVTLKRPKVSRSRDEKKQEEVLVVEGIELVDRDVFVKFDVLIITREHQMRAGSFEHVPHKHKHKHKHDDELSFPLTKLLEELQITEAESVVVKLEPKKGLGQVKIGGLRIESADRVHGR